MRFSRLYKEINQLNVKAYKAVNVKERLYSTGSVKHENITHIEYFLIRTGEIHIVYLDNTSRSQSTSIGLYTLEALIQKEYEGSPDNA